MNRKYHDNCWRTDYECVKRVVQSLLLSAVGRGTGRTSSLKKLAAAIILEVFFGTDGGRKSIGQPDNPSSLLKLPLNGVRVTVIQ